MILWTTQHQQAAERMNETGTLRADEKHLLFDGSFIDSYRWMADQMKKRIGDPPEGMAFPVWAWYQWEGKRSRIDMRAHGWHWGEKGSPIVLLTFDAPDNHVLLSDFDYWHVVLNDGSLIFPFRETAVYTKDEKQKSWENIFDISCKHDGDEHFSLSTQATLWEIKREWIVKEEHFISR